MTVPADPAEEPSLRPPEAEPQRLGSWLLAAVLVLVIVGGAWRAYQWLVTDVERRRAVAEAPPPASAAPAVVAASAAPAPLGRTVTAPQAGVPPEAAAPAAVGQAIHRCRIDGQLTYTNLPCAPGTEDLPAPALGADPNGVVGLAGDSVPSVQPAELSLEGASRSQRDAACAYLAAEIARLEFEFQQPLPPPVLDHLSTRLSGLRARQRAAECGAPAVPAADQASATRRPASPRAADARRAP
ncbi:MAG: hypothetical protein IT498_02035 [Rubrivivax sp.]|uniref:hypothetical protein n=1 Tax=Ottowia sp. TaxID=1898956 RepID=UPI002178729B|nr:hypothetical protein [Ottowia sp.]MCC6812804.1 hypothetical protein [Rubrivivax sp.]HNR82453.1 hypothetical protein [Ottowia sp.]HNT84360.1 hypothetical protein [Ottowia sp.]